MLGFQLLVSLGVLLDSDQRALALAVLRALISCSFRSDEVSRSTEKRLLLANIMKRLTAAESSRIREEFLSLSSKDKGAASSELHAFINESLPKEP